MTQPASLVRLSELDEEDCSFVLRELELNAFTAVVSALRAQGVLNNFKECLLESLKTALFIPDEVYQAEMRKATNDDFLTRVASILNPSYDTFTEWEMSARQLDVDRPFFPPPKLFDNKGVTTSSLALANDLLALCSSHNEVIAEQDIATARLLSIPKLPYVPERLRKLLKDTESLSSERVLPNENDREEEKVVVPKVVPKKIAKVPSILKRKRKIKTNGMRDVSYEKPSTSYSAPEKPAPACRILPPHTSPIKESTSALFNLIPSREAEAMGVKEFITKIQAQIEQEARNGLLGDNGRRKRKPRLGTLLKEQYPECARARPFIFPSRLVDGSKPPRGNPERGATKRAATPGSSPVMVPPITPPNPNGVLQFTSSVSQGVMNHSMIPSTSNDFGMSLTPGHKENNSVAIRPTAGTLPLNHVISKPPSVVSPATTPTTGVIKRPRMGSFTDKVSSPVELTQRAAALRKTYMTPVLNKVKVAVTPPVEVHGQAMPVIPNSKPIYPHTVAVTVNRTQNRTFSTSKDQQRSEPHGHDYVLPKTATIIKKTLIPSPVRALNGVQPLPKAPGQNLAPQTIVREQVVSIVKKASTPPVPLISNVPANLAARKVTPPPTAGSTVQTLAMKKYHAMAPTSSQSPLSVGLILKKPMPEVSSPPVKRVFYCDPSNPTVATLQPADSLSSKEVQPAGPGSSSIEKSSDVILPSISIPVPTRISENPASSSDRPDILQQSMMEIT